MNQVSDKKGSIIQADVPSHYEAKLMDITNGKGIGVIAECEHCGAHRRAKQCEFTRRN